MIEDRNIEVFVPHGKCTSGWSEGCEIPGRQVMSRLAFAAQWLTGDFCYPIRGTSLRGSVCDTYPSIVVFLFTIFSMAPAMTDTGFHNPSTLARVGLFFSSTVIVDRSRVSADGQKGRLCASGSTYGFSAGGPSSLDGGARSSALGPPPI
ncbi:hypothetical protein LZ30DRAFT_687816 [Colletotrichum cereale]|nr:hypothetical protein LZ30DRAFT_687816 [Colletotrichum cereale]